MIDAPALFHGHDLSRRWGAWGKEMFRKMLVFVLILTAALAIFLISQYADTAMYFIQKCLAASVVQNVL